MSSPSKKSTSWFARLGSALGRKQRGSASGQKRRGLRFESLETRALLSATMLPSISGIVYQDMTGNGLTSDDTRLSNVTINLFRDGGDGVFEGKNAGDDTLLNTATSDANGKYTFSNISAGTYFVQEVGVPGLVISSAQSVQKVVVTNNDLQGVAGTTIDSFASTSQYASGSYHGGKTGTSSQSTTDAIGGHRNLYVQLTSAGGSVSLGADSDFPGLLDFASGSASNGIYWVNWDGNNGNAAALNPSGLGQVDITSQGASTGIELNVAGDHDNGFIMLKVFSDANDWSWTSVPISNTSDGALNSSNSQYMAFSSFTVGGGTGANFAQVGAIQLAINGVNANDGQVGPIEAVGPKVFSENFANMAQADLSVVKAASPNPVTAGNQLTYTFTTTNNGPSADTGVALSDTLPAGETFVSSGGQGTVTNTNGQISVQLGNMASGAVATTSIVVTVSSSASGSISNTVTVTGNVTDPNLSNNTSTVTTQINVPVIPQSIHALVITKKVNLAQVTVGTDLVYTVTVTNGSLAQVTGVTAADPLPAGFTYLSSSIQYSPNSPSVPYTPTASGNALDFALGAMASQQTDTITIVGQVTAAAGSTLTNTASVSSTEAGIDPETSKPVVTTVIGPFVPVPSKYYYIVHIQ